MLYFILSYFIGNINDYAELVLQLGYTTLFSAAFPLLPLLAFISQYVEIRIDGWKLCHLYRRIQPKSNEDIGIWMDVMQILTVISIFVNSGLISFTLTNLINYTWNIRIWIFILISFGFLMLRWSIQYIIPDQPEYVEIQIQRQEYVSSKVIDNIKEDDDDGDLINSINSKFDIPDFIIAATDIDPM